MPLPPTRSSRRLAPSSPPPQQLSSGSSSSLASTSSAQSASAILLHPDALPCLKRRQLVSLCGRFGLKASGKNVELVARLQEFAKRNVDAAGPTAGCFAVLRPVKPDEMREGSEEPAQMPQRPETPAMEEMQQQSEAAGEDVDMEDARQEASRSSQADVQEESMVSTAPPSPAPAPSPSPSPSPSPTPAVRRTRRATRATVLPAAAAPSRAVAADVSYPALPSLRAAPTAVAPEVVAPAVPGSWQHAISAQGEMSLPSLDPLQPSIRPVAHMPSDGASDYGSSSISFPGPASPIAPAPQDFAPAPLFGAHKRTTSATSSLLGSLRGLRAKGKVLGEALKGKRKRAASDDDVLANATPQRRRANDDAEMSFVLVSPAPRSAAQAEQEADIGDASTIGASSRRGSTVGASSLRSLFDPPAPSPRSCIAQTAPLRIIKAQPRPSRALQQARSSMLPPASPAASPASSLPAASPVPNPPLPPSASASAFSAAGAAVLAEMNARLVAAGRAPLVSFPDASTWAARRAAAPKMPPLDPQDRFESTHQRGFGSMRSITEHYAARRTAARKSGGGAAKAPLRPNARAAAAAAAAKPAAIPARAQSNEDGEAPSKRSRLVSGTKMRSASAASSAAQVLAAAKARQQAVFGSTASKTKDAPAASLSSSTATAPAGGATLGGRIKGAVRGFVGSSGTRVASVSKPVLPAKASTISGTPRPTSVRSASTLSQPRPAAMGSSSLGFSQRAPSSNATARPAAAQRTASAASTSSSAGASGSISKRPVFDLAASLARKPTYKPYSAAEALAGLSAPTTLPGSISTSRVTSPVAAASRPARGAASRTGDRERKVRSSMHPTARGVAGAKKPRLSAQGKAIVRSAREAQLGRQPVGAASAAGIKRTPAATAALKSKTLPPLPSMQSQATLQKRALAPLRNAAPAPARPALSSA